MGLRRPIRPGLLLLSLSLAAPSLAPGPRAASVPPAPATAGGTAPAGATANKAASPAPAPKSLLAAKLQALYDDGDDPGVKQLAEERLKTAPEDSEARIVYARTLVRLGLKAPTRQLGSDYFTKALEQLIAVRTRFPGRLDVRLFICDVFFHARRPDMLLTEANLLLKEHPADAGLRGEIAFYAEQYMSTNQAKNGASVYSLLARLEPGSAAWASNEGIALLLSGDLSAGTAALLRAVRLDPKDANSAHNLAQAYVYQGNWTAADTWFSQSARLDPERGRYVLDQAVSRSLASPKEAAPLFDQALKILGTDPVQKTIVEQLSQGMMSTNAPADLFERFARELDTGGYPVQALFAIEKSLRQEPDRPTVLLLRADLLERMRFFARALPDYTRVRERLPSLAAEPRETARIPAISGEARCLINLGQAARALEMLRANGGEAAYPFEVADALVATGNALEARSLLERMSNKGTDKQAAEAARQRLRALTEGTP